MLWRVRELIKHPVHITLANKASKFSQSSSNGTTNTSKRYEKM